MSTRLGSALIALVIVSSIVAAEEGEKLQRSSTIVDVCCEKAELVPTIGWKASTCELASQERPHNFCCTEYDTVAGVAVNCIEAVSWV